jgi:hypothetical protein
LRVRIKQGKGVIRRHRSQVAADSAELADLEQQCAQLGIRLITEPPGAED